MPEHLVFPGNTAQHWDADSARIRRELGWREVVPPEKAIRRTIEWVRANPPSAAAAVPLRLCGRRRGGRIAASQKNNPAGDCSSRRAASFQFDPVLVTSWSPSLRGDLYCIVAFRM